MQIHIPPSLASPITWHKIDTPCCCWQGLSDKMSSYDLMTTSPKQTMKTPENERRTNPKSWRFGSDDFPDFNWVIFNFQPFVFGGVRYLSCFLLAKLPYSSVRKKTREHHFHTLCDNKWNQHNSERKEGTSSRSVRKTCTSGHHLGFDWIFLREIIKLYKKNTSIITIITRIFWWLFLLTFGSQKKIPLVFCPTHLTHQIQPEVPWRQHSAC